MQIARTPEEIATRGRGACLALGFFDGVHVGHQQIIGQTMADASQYNALSVVVTFEPHPSTVVAPERVPPLIYSLPQKLRAIESLGVNAVLRLHFNEELRRRTGEHFIRGLASNLGPLRSICVGANFVFGWERSGNADLLKRLGNELKFSVHAMTAVARDGMPISSTRIRQAILAGQLDTASQLLGRPYSVAGPVMRGDEIGRQLGFPTANLDVSGLALPPNGVYAAKATVAGSRYRSVFNIGRRPTVTRDSPLRFEVHLLDFKGDLYGKELEVFILEKLRDEKKFASAAELSEQIQRDIRVARERLDRIAD
jgi:riboflavin kinase / FMN adenylyltransferase